MRIWYWVNALVLCACSGSHTPQQPHGPITANSLKAFSETLYPQVRERCASCHGEHQRPLFAVSDPKAAYHAALPYVNFEDIPSSVFVLRARNGHCGANCLTDGAWMREALIEWHRRAQVSSSTETILTTPELLLDDAFSVGSQRLLSWDLTPLGFTGSHFSIEVERLEDHTFRFQKPRLLAAQALFIAGVEVRVNGVLDPGSHVFASLRATRNAHSSAVLSALSALVAVPNRGPYGVTVRLGALKAASPSTCKDTRRFSEEVLPILERSCFSCHAKPESPAHERFPMDRSDSLCAQALERAQTGAEPAPLIAYPYLQKNGHPVKALSAEQSRTLTAWAASESRATYQNTGP